MKHVMLELYCMYGVYDDEVAGGECIADFCLYGVKKPGYHCLENECNHIAYTKAPHEFAFSDSKGEVSSEAMIGFGGDMEPAEYDENKQQELIDIWAEICESKMDEAYHEYMRITETNRYNKR